MRNPIMSLTRSSPHAETHKLLKYFTINQYGFQETHSESRQGRKRQNLSQRLFGDQVLRVHQLGPRGPIRMSKSTLMHTVRVLIVSRPTPRLPPLYGVARPSDTIKGTPEWNFGMKDFFLARAKCNQEKARGLRAQADELDKWWKKDTKEAARHNIEGKRLAEKEGGASSVDDLFEQTCAEMEAEAAEKAEADKPESGETAESKN
ncbi:hypothetical protein H9Q69_012550 [Fusarium xylarioides]|nr:hypothetical protein H9Q69_012550 [Fusarium xylarioides]